MLTQQNKEFLSKAFIVLLDLTIYATYNITTLYKIIKLDRVQNMHVIQYNISKVIYNTESKAHYRY